MESSPVSLALFLTRFLLLAAVLSAAEVEHGPLLPIGAATVDITPDYPVRLSGYAARSTFSEGIGHRIHASALAFGPHAVVVSVENVGLPFAVTEEAWRRVNAQHPLPRSAFATLSTHTHSAPMLQGVLPNLFSRDLTAEEAECAARYTAELTEKIAQVALQALGDLQPALLEWGTGELGFAINRAEQNGPVDRSLPLLVARSPEGKIRALLANYACHNTSLQDNVISGDWAGYAKEFMETAHPGAVALIAVGCGADANPHPRHSVESARQQGRELATEVERLLHSTLAPVSQLPTCVDRDFGLPFQPLPERAEWESRSREPGITGYHARKNLARLARGESLPVEMPYRVGAWTFGGDLAMLFLGGEVVADYGLLFKSKYKRLWVNAYANDVSAYIPSRRVLALNSYEGGGAQPYYDQPTKFSPEIEPALRQVVHDLIPPEFFNSHSQNSSLPLTPPQSLTKLRLRRGYHAELAACDPQIVDPVALDFGADGRLWVLEMRDYPDGLDGHGQPGGRVKFLEDRDGDGFYETATLFLDELPFPTDIMAWGKGVFVCAAPDILYAEDLDGDGRADKVETWFHGFDTTNFQARVNGLSYGLDGWIYGANGLLGGVIQGAAGTPAVDISGRDFRFHPLTREFQTATGLTQQNRVRSDFGDWFGSDNTNLGWHYPIAEPYLRRNPAVSPSETRVHLEQSRRVYPASETLERFNDPGDANQATSVCGGTVYRDKLLGEELYGDYFVNEPVHDLTTRLKLIPQGVSFTGTRAAGEEQGEFFASTENWSRPVQIRTGPDGALWVADMYRHVIEHPRWIPPAMLATLDLRAGANEGRLYRLLADGSAPRKIRDLTALGPMELAEAFDTTNGPVRDRLQQLLIGQQDPATFPRLAAHAEKSAWPAVRAQALATLACLGALTPDLLERAFHDAHPGVRRVALRFSEPLLADHPGLVAAACSLADDPDPKVRMQLILSLGEAPAAESAPTLCALAINEMADPWQRTALLSSAIPAAPALFRAVLDTPPNQPGRKELAEGLLATLCSTRPPAEIASLIPPMWKNFHVEGADLSWYFDLWGQLLESLDERQMSLETLLPDESGRAAAATLESLHQIAQDLAFEKDQPLATRQAALRLCARSSSIPVARLQEMLAWLGDPALEPMQTSILTALRKNESGPDLAPFIFSHWTDFSPSTRAILIALLLERPAAIPALLEAVETGMVSPAEIPAAHQQHLLTSTEEALRLRARKIFTTSGHAGRAKVVSAYAAVESLTGDVESGREIFAATCAVCHEYRGIGHEVGPDLAAFRRKAPAEFVEAILNPNGAIEPRYVYYAVQMNDGRSLAGLIANENPTRFTLVQPAGLRQEIKRTDISSMEPLPLSLMPDGLEDAINLQQMADLISFLKN